MRIHAFNICSKIERKSTLTEEPKISFKLKNGIGFYAAVGQAASTWAFLETKINLAIISFSKDQAVVVAMLSQLFSIHAKIDSLIAICHEYGVSDLTLKRLHKFSQDLRPLTLQRNRIIHDPIVDDERGQKMTLRLHSKAAKGKIEFDLVPFDVDAISRFIAHVKDRADDFAEIRDAITKERKETGTTW